METDSEYRYQKAKEKVDGIRGFYVHAFIYFVIMGVLVMVNLATTRFPWAVFPALGWGLGLLSHGLKVYGKFPFLGAAWEERKIREFMQNDKM